MASLMSGKYTDESSAYYGCVLFFLDIDYNSEREYIGCLIKTHEGIYGHFLKSNIKLIQHSKHDNFTRNKGAFYDNRTSRLGNRIP